MLKQQCDRAKSGANWRELLFQNEDDFFGSPAGAKLVHKLSPVMKSSEELRKIHRKTLQDMANILSELFRHLGSNWSEQGAE